MTPRNPADRPATEPRTEAGKRHRQILREWCDDGIITPGTLIAAEGAILAIEAEAAQGAAPLDDFDSWEDMIENQHMIHDEGAAPRAEGLDVRLLNLIDAYQPAKPGWGYWQSVFRELIELARLSRPSDERVPESEEA